VIRTFTCILSIKCYRFSFSWSLFLHKECPLTFAKYGSSRTADEPTEFKIFTERNFTIRRFDNFWPGLWSDLIVDVLYEKLRWIDTCAWNLQQWASTVDRKNGVHYKHTCICQNMYPPELKLKRANEWEENNSWSIKIKITCHLLHEPVPNEHTWGVRWFSIQSEPEQVWRWGNSISPPTSQTLFKLLTTHTKLR
jgi:hypothetical protein